ncbi:hypothetical protein KJ359_002215 [Pestalotiopsis sp. 9143b]|nr:hypothetical protein KJ359_002215 [Pestalotiopsis sp. 9143b]
MLAADEEKKRFFKIEKSQTAPSKSVWSNDKVKKRRFEDHKAQKAAVRTAQNRNRVKRSPALGSSLSASLLAHEHHGMHNRAHEDMGAALVAANMNYKGVVLFNDMRWGRSQHISSMSVVGKDQVHRQLLTNYSVPGNRIAPYHEGVLDQVSAIKYHRGRNILITAQAAPDDEACIRARGIKTFPEFSADSKTPRVRLGEGSYEIRVHGNSLARLSNANSHSTVQDYYEVNAIATGPDSSTAVCAVGSNKGILQWTGSSMLPLGDSLDWLAPSNANSTHDRAAFKDIMAVDFCQGHENLVFGGGRPGRCFVGDSRAKERHWQSFYHGSSITHIKSINERHVLVSGLRDTMRIYDTRMVKKFTKPATASEYYRHESKPKCGLAMIEFPEYQNDAHIKIGLDVELEDGVVAAAHNDGAIALYSLKSGHKLRSPDIDKARVNVEARGPVKALQFEKMAGDSHSSLFVGVGPTLMVFSYGGENGE